MNSEEQKAYDLAVENHDRAMARVAELEREVAALKAQPGGAALPARDWLQSGGLLYSLENGENHYEINVNQVAGSRHDDGREKLACELLKVLNGASLNQQPAPAGDDAERAAFEDVSKLTVSAEPLRQVLNALVNAPHMIRELQATREPVALFADNPINILIAEYNAANGAEK